jgi:hypothetical protein
VFECLQREALAARLTSQKYNLIFAYFARKLLKKVLKLWHVGCKASWREDQRKRLLRTAFIGLKKSVL